jgi:S1-C subfamily serine protease
MFKLLKKAIRFLLYSSILCGLIIKLPEWHYSYIRNKVGSKVVTIVHHSGRGGGTGFYVKGASGNTYIMSNSHVCDYAAKNGKVFVKEENETRMVERKVLESSAFTDLCLIEAVSDKDGLKVGEETTSWSNCCSSRTS